MSATPVANAGGFHLSAEAPGAESQSQFKDAVLVVRTFGCNQPDNAMISASAEGLVNGQRQSAPLRLNQISKGVYAIVKQWPSTGSWVVTISGEYNGMKNSLLVELDRTNKTAVSASRKSLAKLSVARKLTSEEVDNALRGMVKAS
jgi:hypothetical protein